MKQHLPKEDLLHYVWKMMRLDLRSLHTVCGETLHIFNTGYHNTNAGPDFLEAKIKIGETLWAGNVEIHVRSSDWIKHKHQNDPAYNNVILHVVFEDDAVVYNHNGLAIPTVELKNKMDASLIDKHLNLIASSNWIPCENLLEVFPKSRVSLFLERLMVERLEQKILQIEKLYQDSNQDWEETLYHLFAINFGFKVNAHAFKRLAEITPYKIVSKYKHNTQALEALFFGQSGLLEQHEDDFVIALRKEYQYLQQKHGLTPMHFSEWKFLRLRPVNFPTIRIAQFCKLLSKEHLFQKIKSQRDLASMYNLFDMELALYWDEHYSFKSKSKAKKKRLGKSSIDLLVINVVVPILFFYGRKIDNEDYITTALEIMKRIKPEKNHIISKWRSLGIEIKSACDSQALYHLKNLYCDQQYCLRCQIGNHIMLYNHSADLA